MTEPGPSPPSNPKGSPEASAVTGTSHDFPECLMHILTGHETHLPEIFMNGQQLPRNAGLARRAANRLRYSPVRADRPGSASLAVMNATPQTPEPTPSSYAEAGVDEEREQVAFARVMRPWLARTKVRSDMVTCI